MSCISSWLAVSADVLLVCAALELVMFFRCSTSAAIRMQLCLSRRISVRRCPSRNARHQPQFQNKQTVGAVSVTSPGLATDHGPCRLEKVGASRLEHVDCLEAQATLSPSRTRRLEDLLSLAKDWHPQQSQVSACLVSSCVRPSTSRSSSASSACRPGLKNCMSQFRSYYSSGEKAGTFFAQGWRANAFPSI